MGFLRHWDEHGYNVKSWKRLFTLAEGFRPTRPNVATAREFRYNGWFVQPLVNRNDADSAENRKALDDFLANIGPLEEVGFGPVTHGIVRDIEPMLVASLLERTTFHHEDGVMPYVAPLLRLLSARGSLEGIDVIQINGGQARRRSLSSIGRISQLMQGHTPRVSSGDPKYYPGDRNLHDNRPQLQIHTLKPRGGEQSYTAFAMYLPHETSEALGRLVRGDV